MCPNLKQPHVLNWASCRDLTQAHKGLGFRARITLFFGFGILTTLISKIIISGSQGDPRSQSQFVSFRSFRVSWLRFRVLEVSVSGFRSSGLAFLGWARGAREKGFKLRLGRLTSRVAACELCPESCWVAVKELKLSYYIGETLLFTICTHYGNLI